MDLKEAVALLGWRREEVVSSIVDGVLLPTSKTKIRLEATKLDSGGYDITEPSLDAFIVRFEGEEPGRHPPVAVRRELLVECAHRCAICRDSAPLEFHHMLEWAKIGHHDPSHMLAICGTCHSKCTKGIIDYKAQCQYKEKVTSDFNDYQDELWGSVPLRVSWEHLREVVLAVHGLVCADKATSSDSKFDLKLIELAEKNEKNNVGADYFRMMCEHHEPYFTEVDSFLESPANEGTKEAYLETVDEIRTQLAASATTRRRFEEYLIAIRRRAKAERPRDFSKNGRLLSLLLSYMYFNCDIGVK